MTTPHMTLCQSNLNLADSVPHERSMPADYLLSPSDNRQGISPERQLVSPAHGWFLLKDDDGRCCALCAAAAAVDAVCGENKHLWLLQPHRLDCTLAEDETATFTLIVVILLK